MWFVLLWLAVLVVDLLVWVVLTRSLGALLVGYRLFPSRRSWIFRNGRPELPSTTVPDDVKEALSKDNTHFGLVPPPPNVRKTISVLVLLENVLAIGIVGGTDAAQTICRRSGQLAVVNTVPLVLLAFPDLVLGRMVKQHTHAIIWAHHVFGWLIWLNTLVHVALSNVLLTGSSTLAVLVFGIIGAITLYFTLLSKVKFKSNTTSGGQDPNTIHKMLGAAFLGATLLHTPTGVLLAFFCISASLFFVGALSRNPNAVPVRLRVVTETAEPEGLLRALSCEMDTATIAEGQRCYFKVDGKPVELAWTNKRALTTWSNLSASFSFTLIARCASEPQITGPFYLPPRRHIYAGKHIILYCADSGFPEAHRWLHELRQCQEEKCAKIEAYICWVQPSQWLRERFKLDHDCALKEYILKSGGARLTRPSDVSRLFCTDAARIPEICHSEEVRLSQAATLVGIDSPIQLPASSDTAGRFSVVDEAQEKDWDGILDKETRDDAVSSYYGDG